MDINNHNLCMLANLIKFVWQTIFQFLLSLREYKNLVWSYRLSVSVDKMATSYYNFLCLIALLVSASNAYSNSNLFSSDFALPASQYDKCSKICNETFSQSSVDVSKPTKFLYLLWFYLICWLIDPIWCLS